MASDTLGYRIRRMRPDELRVPVEWAAKEGWNPGRKDAQCYYAADPKGFFLGEIEGEPIACISAVAYANGTGFIGFYIVSPSFRGKGYGIQIWDEAMKYLAGRNVALDGVVAQQENYKKSGFKLAYQNVRYRGQGGKIRFDATGIVPISQVQFESLAKYDLDTFGFPRSEFLKCWIQQPEGAAFAHLSGKELSGYTVLRPCVEGFKIGPLVANSPAIAEKLFAAAMSEAGDRPVFLDPPGVNESALDLVKRYKMKPVFETARMYTKEQPDLPIDRVFGITSFEIG